MKLFWNMSMFAYAKIVKMLNFDSSDLIYFSCDSVKRAQDKKPDFTNRFDFPPKLYIYIYKNPIDSVEIKFILSMKGEKHHRNTMDWKSVWAPFSFGSGISWNWLMLRLCFEFYLHSIKIKTLSVLFICVHSIQYF